MPVYGRVEIGVRCFDRIEPNRHPARGILPSLVSVHPISSPIVPENRE